MDKLDQLHIRPYQKKNFLINFFLNTKHFNEKIYIAGVFNLNLLDYNISKKGRTIYIWYTEIALFQE